MTEVDIAIIGAGPAGLAAAVAAYDAGAADILILDRDSSLGGILNQCTHEGFGEYTFGEVLDGPAYAERCAKLVVERGIRTMQDTIITDLTPERVLTAVNSHGLHKISARSIVLATGCRERGRGVLGIAGDRPAGVLTAGTAQKLVNTYGLVPGREIVILGSGDIGLIAARLLTINGARIKAVVERNPQSPGLAGNIEQCLDAFGIELRLSHNVTRIEGRERVTGVYVAKVGENMQSIPGTEELIPCDTLLLSVGLIPENELASRAGVRLDARTGGAVVDETCRTSVPGVFACGNAVRVHQLVDNVYEEGALAGRHAAQYVLSCEGRHAEA
ncbi:MAG: NAD(P)/FAD-dependent oxidoreductase [Defluviitaleaceae bacterium]|nr:NAD(P)/FAD-dependent oxidoreductase [Defluviitaleaceae bacterium]